MCNRWAVVVTVGVDVGGAAKGFDVCVADGAEVLELVSGCTVDAVVALVNAHSARAAGIDSPDSCAAPGEKSRPGERQLARELCPIFYTPEEIVVRSGHPFYGWMCEGLDLYEALAEEQPATERVEVFPSAAWTVWAGKRNGRPKSRWSRLALERVGVRGLPRRCSQDARDAVGAALVAGLFLSGETVSYGGIAVPRAGSVALTG